jgi:hypothetical protein
VLAKQIYAVDGVGGIDIELRIVGEGRGVYVGVKTKFLGKHVVGF